MFLYAITKILSLCFAFSITPAFAYKPYKRRIHETNWKKNVSELLFVIDTELDLLKMRMQGLLPALPVKPVQKLRWTGKATDLVELLYALDTCDCINNGEIGVEELADALSELFGIEIKNCYNVYMNMKRRKDDSRTYFLDELREKLNKRMVESDLKGGKFKKR